jgi:hypothetical protein
MVGTGINETLTKVFLAEAAKPTLVKKKRQDWLQNLWANGTKDLDTFDHST